MKGEYELKRADFEELTTGVYYDPQEHVLLIRSDEVLREVFPAGSLRTLQEERDVLLHSVMSAAWDAISDQGRRVDWISLDCRPPDRYVDRERGAK